MSKSLTRKFMIIGVVIATLIPLRGAVGGWLSAASDDGTITLQPPPFVNIAHAQGGTSFADSEAGIAAYIRASSTINLAQTVPFYRTIEEQNDDYILGSLEVTDYDDNHDVKVYIHKDGWVMAYYPRSEPTSRIFDWLRYDGSGTLPTKLEEVLTRIGTQVGAPAAAPTYYHFSHPNANRLMLVADNLSFSQGNASESFEIELPDTYDYKSNSWSFVAFSEWLTSAEFMIDGANVSTITRNDPSRISQGIFSATQLTTGRPHTITFDVKNQLNASTSSSVGLAIIYEVP